MYPTATTANIPTSTANAKVVVAHLSSNMHYPFFTVSSLWQELHLRSRPQVLHPLKQGTQPLFTQTPPITTQISAAGLNFVHPATVHSSHPSRTHLWQAFLSAYSPDSHLTQSLFSPYSVQPSTEVLQALLGQI